MNLKFVKAVFAGNKLKVFISRKPANIGGGSNTFAGLFTYYAKLQGYKIVSKITNSQKAVIVAHLGDTKDIAKAKSNGCYIIHRLDEHFPQSPEELMSDKHKKIIELNKFADVTVFQSKFVFENVYPFIKPERYKIIYNGSDPKVFNPASKIGNFIGHVSWGIGEKKRLDLLKKFIIENPNETFLLVGRHTESEIDFNLPNVILKGPIKRDKLPDLFKQMKMLYFPSENDPCPNTVVEAIMSGVPVCYNPKGGTIELVQKCGEPLEDVKKIMENYEFYRDQCISRTDLYFDNVIRQYLEE